MDVAFRACFTNAQRLTELIERAAAADVPISTLADALGVERKTVCRRLGRPMR